MPRGSRGTHADSRTTVNNRKNYLEEVLYLNFLSLRLFMFLRYQTELLEGIGLRQCLFGNKIGAGVATGGGGGEREFCSALALYSLEIGQQPSIPIELVHYPYTPVCYLSQLLFPFPFLFL